MIQIQSINHQEVFVLLLLKQQRRIQGQLTESSHDIQKQAQYSIYYSTTVLEEILLELHHHIAKSAWLTQKYLRKKVIKTITENSVEVGLFATSVTQLIQFCLFRFKVIADQLFYSYKFYLYQNVYIYIYIYTYVYFLP